MSIYAHVATDLLREVLGRLEPEEFMRSFLLHALLAGSQRIRRYGPLALGCRKANPALARKLLSPPNSEPTVGDDEEAKVKPLSFVCLHCSSALLIVRTFSRGHGDEHCTRRAAPSRAILSGDAA